MISMHRPEMESRPSEFLLQYQGAYPCLLIGRQILYHRATREALSLLSKEDTPKILQNCPGVWFLKKLGHREGAY